MADQTEMRVVELNEIVNPPGIEMCEYVIQYRNDGGRWISLPVVLVFDKDKYQRMKDGADD